MKKLKILIIAIAVICVITGSYAVYLGNGNLNTTTDMSLTTQNVDVAIDNQNTSNNPSMDENNLNTNNNPTQGNIPINFGNTYKKVPDTYILINEAVDYTDMYILCPSCGGFVALGEVTKALPEGAICPDLCGGYPTLDKDYLSTYEEAYSYWQESGDRCTEGEIIDYHNPEHYNPDIEESGNNVENIDAQEFTPQIVADFTKIY